MKHLERRIENLEALNNLHNIYSPSRSLRENLHKALHTLLTRSWLPITPMGALFLAEKENNQDVLKLFTDISLNKPLLKLCETIPFGYCLCGRAAQKKEIIFKECVDCDHDISFDNMKPHGHYNVPILDPVDHSVAGVIVLYTEHGRVYSEEEASFLADAARVFFTIIDTHKKQNEIDNFKSKSLLSSIQISYGHELNNPLATAMGFTELLQSENPTDKKIQKIFTALKRMSETISKFQKLARSETQLLLTDYADDQKMLDIQSTLSVNQEVTEIVMDNFLVSKTDVNGTITFVNEKMAEVSGYPPQELIGENHRILNSGIHPKSFQKKMWDQIKSGQPWRGIYKNKSKDGSIYWVDSIISPIRDLKGDIEGFMSIRYQIKKRSNS